MSRVIRSKKIDDGFFPLVINEVERTSDYLTPKAIEADEQNLQEKTIEVEIQQQLLAAQEKARKVVLEAERQGQEVLNQFREQGYKEGFEKGLEEGRNHGLAEAAEMTESIRIEANNLLHHAEAIRTQLMKGAEEEVVELAMTIASKVIRSHVEVKRDAVVQLAVEALERAVAAGYYTIFVNPEDVGFLKEYISELRRSASGNSRIHIVPDSSIGEGGCKVETENGIVDVTLESQLEQIRKTLREALEGKV